MKVLYVQPGLGIGGSKISLYHMLKCAPQEQVTHVALSAPREIGYEEKIRRHVTKIHYLSLPTWNKYRRISIVDKAKAPFSHMKRLMGLIPSAYTLAHIIKKENIDLVHTNNGMCAVGALAAHLAGVPHVWHVREAIGTGGVFSLILGDRLSAKIFHRFSDAIICNSQFTSVFFQKYGYKAQVVQNGLDLQTFQQAENRGQCLRKEFSRNCANPVVAMIGNLTTVMKKHDRFLEVVARVKKNFPNCQFVVFGGSTDLNQTSYTRSLRQIADNLKISDRVVWADFIEDVPAIMQSIDILVHPASKEGSGRVIMEAMAAGRAVVGVRSGGVQELIIDKINGFLVSPDDIQDMADKVQCLLGNSEERTSMGIRASEYAKKNFTNDAMMRSILEIYRELIQEQYRCNHKP